MNIMKKIKTGLIIYKNNIILGFTEKGFFAKKSLFLVESLKELDNNIIWFSNLKNNEYDHEEHPNIKKDDYFGMSQSMMLKYNGFKNLDIKQNQCALKFTLKKIYDTNNSLIENIYSSYRNKELELVNFSVKKQNDEIRKKILFAEPSYKTAMKQIKDNIISHDNNNKLKDVIIKRFKIEKKNRIILNKMKNEAVLYPINNELINKIKKSSVIGFDSIVKINFTKKLKTIDDIEKELLPYNNLLFIHTKIKKYNGSIRIFKKLEDVSALCSIDEFLFYFENDFDLEIDYCYEANKNNCIENRKYILTKEILKHNILNKYKNNAFFDFIVSSNYLQAFIMNDNILFNELIKKNINSEILKKITKLEKHGIEVISYDYDYIKISFDDKDKEKIKKVLDNITILYPYNIL